MSDVQCVLFGSIFILVNVMNSGDFDDVSIFGLKMKCVWIDKGELFLLRDINDFEKCCQMWLSCGLWDDDFNDFIIVLEGQSNGICKLVRVYFKLRFGEFRMLIYCDSVDLIYNDVVNEFQSCLVVDGILLQIMFKGWDVNRKYICM